MVYVTRTGETRTRVQSFGGENVKEGGRLEDLVTDGGNSK